MDKWDQPRFTEPNGAFTWGCAGHRCSGGESVSSGVRRRVAWFAATGPVVTIADVAAVLLAGLLARAVGSGLSPWPVLVAALVAGLVARAADLHRPRLVLSILQDLPGLVLAAAAATLVLLVNDQASAAFAVLTLAMLVLAHSLVHGATHLLRSTGRLRSRVLIVGTGATARRLALTLLRRPAYGLAPVGLVGTGDRDTLGQARGLPLALLGMLPALPRIMTEADVDAVVFALPYPAGDAEVAAVTGCLAASVDVYAVPSHFPPAEAHARHPREQVGDVALVHVPRSRTWAPVRKGKRLTDGLVAAVTLAAVLPLALVVGVLVRIETGGVLVAQPRIDERGRPTTVPRFRTRRARALARPGTTWSVAISGRVGPIGRLVRRSRLDELPELVRALIRRIIHPRKAIRDPLGSATAPRADQTKIDAGQLAG